MEQTPNECNTENVLIKGCVRYDDCSPVKQAIVILEKIYCEYNEELQMNKIRYIYLTHTLTNKHGEFSFIVTDKLSCYLVKVFNNHQRRN